MRPLLECDTIQIEITNQCHHRCSNCTRLVGHHPKPYFMDFDQFKQAVDSMEGFPKMVGVMGGEPLLHPEFDKFCDYLKSKIPAEQCGLWTCFPDGKEHHRGRIASTFGNIFLNDQSRNDILHGPVLVASEELPIEPMGRDMLIDRCWVQNYWSASINPHGAFFCEIAAALSMLLSDKADGWPVEKHWWARVPKHYVEQMDKYCVKCGAAMPLKKRFSFEGIDDISPGMLALLKDKSPKIKKGDFKIHNLMLEQDDRKIATYKDEEYRSGIAARYGMFLVLQKSGFQRPYLDKNYKGPAGNGGNIIDFSEEKARA